MKLAAETERDSGPSVCLIPETIKGRDTKLYFSGIYFVSFIQLHSEAFVV
jgi:hypothetical protein